MSEIEAAQARGKEAEAVDRQEAAFFEAERAIFDAAHSARRHAGLAGEWRMVDRLAGELYVRRWMTVLHHRNLGWSWARISEAVEVPAEVLRDRYPTGLAPDDDP